MAHKNKTKSDNYVEHRPNFIFGFLRRHWRTRTLAFVAAIVVILALASGSYALFFASTPQTTGQSIDLGKGLVGYWKLNGNAKDSTPYGHNGTVNGAAVSTGPHGEASGSYSFSGSNSISIANPLGQAATSEAWTVSAWVKVTSSNNFQYLLSGFNNGLYLNYYNGDLLLYLNSSANDYYSYGNYVLNGTGWHYVTYVFRNSDALRKVYVDGVDVTGFSKNLTSTPLGLSSTINIGTNLIGGISQLRIYNRVLNSSEIQALYDSYSPEASINNLSGGLVGHWKLNGNAKDSTPYSHGGVISGGVTPLDGPNGQPGGAYHFDGSSGKVVMGDLSYDNSNVFSVSVWIRANTDGTIIDSYQSGSYQGFRMYVNSGALCAWYLTGGSVAGGHVAIGDQGNASCIPISVGAWHHATVAVDPAGMYVYVDGSFKVASSWSNTPGSSTSTTPLSIGYYPGSVLPYSYSGDVSDLRIYNRVLSSDEVEQLYDSYGSQASFGVATAPSGQTVCVTCGLVGYWPLDGSAKDMTPYGDNGTLMGGVTPTTDRFGKANGAMSFDGVDSQISVSSKNVLNFGSGGLTISFWIKPTSISSGMEDLMGKFQNNIGGYYITQASDTMLMFTKDYSHYLYSDFNSLVAGKWAHVVYTISPGALGCYINSVKCTRTPVGPPLNDIGQTGNNLIIGGPGPYGSRFSGSIANLRIYNRALSADEVAALYNLRD